MITSSGPNIPGLTMDPENKTKDYTREPWNTKVKTMMKR